MAKYVALPPNPSGREPARVALQEDSGAFVTVMSLTAHDKRFPVETLKFLQNFAALLNGHDPIYQIPSQGTEIYYHMIREHSHE